MVAMRLLAVGALLLASLHCTAAAAATPPAPKPQRAVGGKAGCLYPDQPCQSTTQARQRTPRMLSCATTDGRTLRRL